MKKIIITFIIFLFIFQTLLMNYSQIEVNATLPPDKLVEKVKDVFSGPKSCIMYLMEDGTLFAGGGEGDKTVGLASDSPRNGQLGTFITEVFSKKLPSASQVNLTNVLGNVKKVEIGYDYSILLDDKGYIYTTGQNGYGQLGMGNTTNLTIFTRVPLPEDIFIEDITAGAQTAYALASNGDLYGWGGGGQGALNQGDTSKTTNQVNSTPKIIATDVTQVSANKSDTTWETNHYNALYIVKTDGNLYVCGNNNRGQLGVGNTKDLTTLTNIPLFNDLEIEQIQAGNAKAFVLLKDGTAYATGTNYYGGLGVNASKDVGKTPALDTGTKNVETWAPIVIPNGHVIEKLFRCSTSQMFQLRNLETNDRQIWGSGKDDDGDMGFYSTGNTWNALGKANAAKYLLTNIATLEQTDVNGNLVNLDPDNKSNDKTNIHIYDNGPIKALSGNWDTSYIVDADGYLRIAGDNAHTYSSLAQYTLDAAENSSKRQFYRTQQTSTRSILDPEVNISGHKSATTLPIAGFDTLIPTNPTTITMGPKQSDIAAVYEKYIISNYDFSTNKTGTAVITSTANNETNLVTDTPLTLDITSLGLSQGGYKIEVYRTCTIPAGETGANTALESNHITRYFKIAKMVSLSYDSNTGTGSPPAETTEYGEGSNVPILDNTYTKVGHKFVNWNTASNGSGDSYYPGDEMKIPDNTTLYAQWSPLYPNYKEENGIFITANNFILNISEVDGLNDNDIKTKSDVDAWNLSDNTSIKPEITVNHLIAKAIGRYLVTFSVRDVNLEVYAYVKDDDNSTIDESQNILIIGKGFTIDTETVKRITDEEIFNQSGAKAWNLTTNEVLDLTLDRTSLNENSGIGPHEVTFSVDNVSHKIIISVTEDSNTSITDNIAIYGKSFIINEGESLTDDDILSKSNAKAWNVLNGLDLTSQIQLNKDDLDTSSIGWHPVTLSIDTAEHEIGVNVIDPTDTTVDEEKGIIIYAKDFSVALAGYTSINIINNSNAKAWNISNGNNLIDEIEVDRSSLKEEVGKYEVDLKLNGVIHTITVNISHSDIIPPEIISITAITPSEYKGEWTNQNITLSIVVSDDEEIDPATFKVSYDGKTWATEGFVNKIGSDDKKEYSAELTIPNSKEGKDQNIYIRVSDLSGNTSDDKYIKINIDITSPETNYEDKTYTFEELEKITFSDKLSGILSATLDDVDILPSGSNSPGVGKHTLVIKDNAGNTTTKEFTVEGYKNEIKITGKMLNDNEEVLKIPRLNNGALEEIIPETSIILKNLTSKEEYIGFLNYENNLVYKNIPYGDYEVFFINTPDINTPYVECTDIDISGNKFTFTTQKSNIEFTITSDFIILNGFGNILEENDQ